MHKKLFVNVITKRKKTKTGLSLSFKLEFVMERSTPDHPLLSMHADEAFHWIDGIHSSTQGLCEVIQYSERRNDCGLVYNYYLQEVCECITKKESDRIHKATKALKHKRE